MKTGIEIIAEERQRQIAIKGWTPEHDNEQNNSQLALAAAAYALPESVVYPTSEWITDREEIYPFDYYSWRPSPDNRVRELAKAGALIAAEIDRLQRLTAPAPASGKDNAILY